MTFDAVLFGVLLCACASACAAAEPDCSSGAEFLPHPTDCGLFIACQDGEPVVEACPEGLWWNPTTSQCDWPDASFCTPGSTSSTATSETTSAGSSTASTSGTTIDSPCIGNLPEFFPHPTDCTLFYKCYQGEAVLESCPPGLWWHQSMGACDWPDESFCTPGSTTTTSSTGSTPTPAGPDMPCPDADADADALADAVRYPHMTECGVYYLCVGGGPVLYACPPGEEFDPLIRHCAPVATAGCSQCPAEPTSGVVVRLSHESQCHLYYRCEDTTPALYQCQLDHHFSRFDRQCHPQDEAFCRL